MAEPADDIAGELDDEDRKLVTLARSARARTGALEGAAVRDDIGRTYAAASVVLAALRLTAVQTVVAAAVSSGSDAVEAVVLHTTADRLADEDAALLAELGAQVVLLAAADGSVRRVR
jgi:hypothetical protein